MEEGPTAHAIDWAQLVRTYQRGPASESGPVLIAALANRLRARARQIPAAPPVIDPDDIWQSLCLEALAAAAALDLPQDPRWIPVTLVERAGRVVSRAVVRELRLAAGDLSEDTPASAGPGIEELPAPFGVSCLGDSNDARLIHQRHVLGLDYSSLGANAAAKPEAIRQRVSRARRRLQASIRRSGELESRGSNAARTRI